MSIETAKELLGRAIREQRERQKLSQQALGELAGINKEAVSLLETGKTWPQYPTLKAIAAALRVAEIALFSLAPAPEPTAAQALEVIARELETRRETPARDTLAERIAKLTPDARQAVLDLVVGLEDSAAPANASQGLAEKDE